MGASTKEQFKGIFTYTDEILDDFAAMYRAKTAVSPVTRLILALIGLVGIGAFVVLMVLNGFSVSYLIPVVFFALILLLSLMIGRKKADSSVERYRKHYLNKRVHVALDNSGIELKINGQKSYARSKYKDVYSLLESEKSLFLEIKGRAFYILPKAGMDGSIEALKEYVQKKCGKKFQLYDLKK